MAEGGLVYSDLLNMDYRMLSWRGWALKVCSVTRITAKSAPALVCRLVLVDYEPSIKLGVRWSNPVPRDLHVHHWEDPGPMFHHLIDRCICNSKGLSAPTTEAVEYVGEQGCTRRGWPQAGERWGRESMNAVHMHTHRAIWCGCDKDAKYLFSPSPCIGLDGYL